MSDILIRGMEMPQICFKCKLSRIIPSIYIFCPLNEKCYPADEMPSDCPLVPVPPHGDLIDRDAARGNIKPWSPEDERNGCTFDTVKKLMYTMLDRAPTVIPASEEET